MWTTGKCLRIQSVRGGNVLDNYVIFHLHSDLSNGTTNIDSVTKYKQYVDRAKQLGMNALGFSEHGNIFEWVHKKEAIEKAEMKYIHGIEAYITESIHNKIRDNYHCVLMARNYDGVLELNKLVSEAYNRNDGHFYYMPRILYDDLENTSDNIIISTACLGGILHKGSDNIINRFICFLQDNKHRCFLEIQHHNDDTQKEYNKYLYALSQEINVPLIAGTDTHALNDTHLRGRGMLQKSKGVFFSDEESWDLTFKSYDELINAYIKQDALPIDIVKTAIDNTNVLQEMIEPFKLDRSYKYPKLWENPMRIFKEKIDKGIKRRGVDQYDNYQSEYIPRIENEIKTYEHNGAIDFMLLTEDLLSWCKENEIEVGYGRGSVNGSEVAYLLGITEMDSIKHKLNFERFMNTERVSLADIDTDFPPSKVEMVKQYLYSKEGLHCCDIVTFNTIADKGAIRDIGRALGIPLAIVGEICDSVDNEELYKKSKEKYKELFEYVDIVKGTIVSVGSHPCGLVVAGFPIEDKFGTFTTSSSKYPISQINMKEIDSLNYVKLDLLSLDTIELINETCKLAGIKRLTPDNVDITDEKVWCAIRDDTTQIFQWEGNAGNTYIKKLLSDDNIKKFQAAHENVDKMTLLTIGNSAIRPAGASYRDDLANGVIRKTGSAPIDDFLSNTFGYLVFQEQIISFLNQYCGFTMGEADIVRRGFAKKTGTDKYIPIIKNGGYLTEESKHYIKGYIDIMNEKYNISREKSEEDIAAFIQVIEDASDYLFSQNHSQPYSYEGYVSGYLRTYYPLEFLTTALNINKDKSAKTKALTAYIKERGIAFQSPEFGHSKAEYFYDKSTNTIYKGIGSIKYMNDTIANELFYISQKKNLDFIDVLYAIKEETSLNSRQLDILIKIDFFKRFGDINQLLNIRDKFDMLYGKKQIKKDKQLFDLGIDESVIRKFSESETNDSVKDIDCESFVESLGYDDAESALEDCVKYKYDRALDGEVISKTINGYSMAKVIKKFSMTPEQIDKFATKRIYGRFTDIHIADLLKYVFQNTSINKCTLSQKLKYQIEHLGYIDYTNPDIDKRYVAILDLDTKYSPKFNAYCLSTGEVCEMKIHSKLMKKDKIIKTSYAEIPIEDGDVIYMKKCIREPRKKKVDNKWTDVPGEYVWWINDYVKIDDLEVSFDN